MAKVALDVGGRQYVVACRDGGEEHLRGLATLVDAKVVEASAAVGTASEVRQLLFAALLLADDLQEGVRQPGAAPAHDATDVDALAAIALRIEAVADALESLPAKA